jgi:hypothetical protein
VDADGAEPPSDADPLRAAAWHGSSAMKLRREAELKLDRVSC